MSERDKTILSLFEVQDSITRKDVEKVLSISRATAVKIINTMIDKKQIIASGMGKNTKYLKRQVTL